MKTKTRSSRFSVFTSRPRGFFATEAAWSLGLALLLLMILTTMIVQQNKAESKLATIRATTRATESALLDLQSGKELPPGFLMEKLSTPAPPNHTWIRITSPSNDSLIGLIRGAQ
ncbi:MAG: hypothetical protein FWD53_04655 [Phycisphaerales bacterium]|nr:hypothetical protein [Phycisphaerales bacterium]